MEGTLMEFWVTASLAGLGYDDDNGVRLVEGFTEVHPDGGAIAEQNMRTGVLSVTFGLDAADIESAYRAAKPIVDAGLASAAFPASSLLGLHMRTAAVDEYYDAPDVATN
jgi:hypothetical protein